MKKIFAFAMLFAAVSLVACGGENKKKNQDEQEGANIECCGDCEECEECECEECYGDCSCAEEYEVVECDCEDCEEYDYEE